MIMGNLWLTFFVENLLKNWYLIHNSYHIFFRSSISMSDNLFVHIF